MNGAAALRYECRDSRNGTRAAKCMLAEQAGADGLFADMRACLKECEKPRERSEKLEARSARMDELDKIDKRDDSLGMEQNPSEAMLQCFVPQYPFPIELTIPTFIHMTKRNHLTRCVWTRKLGGDAINEGTSITGVGRT